MAIRGKKVLVTGAGGFIGSHLVETLVQQGASVRAMVHYNALNSWGNLEYLSPQILKEVDVFQGDITDPYSVHHSVQERDVVFHLAALIGIPYSYVAPRSYVETNILGTLHVMNACRDLGISRVVHTSTSETYGTALYTPIDEKHPLQGQSPYSASKIGADKMAESYHRSFNVPVVTVRPFNTYGPRQSARAIIPTILSQVLSGCDTLRLGSLAPLRDFTFVQDTVQGFIAAAESPKALGETINLGSGIGVTIGDVAQTILKLTGKTHVKLEEDSQRIRPEKSEVMTLICSATKAQTLCGWQPQTTLTAGLTATMQFMKDHLNQYKTDLYNV